MPDSPRTIWRGYRSERFTSPAGDLVVVPELGARIVSLSDATGHEWLVQPHGHRVRRETGEFTSVPPYGWDEMMPSIDRCTVQGSDTGDHGAAWNAPWRVAGSSLAIDDRGGRYTFAREVSPSPSGFVLNYEVIAHETVDVLWAPHPLIHMPQGAHFRVDEAASWVRVDDQSLQPVEAIMLPSDLATGHSRKFYSNSPLDSVRIRDAEHCLELAWDAGFAPYLGVYSENRHWTAMPCLAIEPSTSWYDALDRAVENGTALRLTRGERRRWDLRINLRSVEPLVRC